ncbi:queuosine precursor transporter [Marispirochaeta sp.]|jgi:queuosine precursor transporter|uniref:queuosine precursor transporter n=1 Tax=Marispirochaeta sp. TaxID=2038653 RepID=UPI0029C9726C|nr:queuosine precursor transporter [Marispirochaeta sp.]
MAELGFPLQNEALWALLLFINFFTIIVLYRVMGKTGLYIWIPISVIIANIQVLKTVNIFGFTATLGNIVYATSFLVTDILSENYGKNEAKKAVWVGFFAIFVMTLFMNIAIWFVPAPSDFAQEALSSIFLIMPRIAGASLAAYILSQRHDVWAYSFWRNRFPEDRQIWIRNNLSTMVSQLIDSIVFVLIAFWGLYEMRVLMDILITTYVIKWLVAVADTPFIYWAKRIREKYL